MAKKRISKKIEKRIDNFLDTLEKDNFLVEKAILFGSWAKGRISNLGNQKNRNKN